MTILSSLKKLHKKMTGQDTTNKTISGVLDSIQENYTVQSEPEKNFIIIHGMLNFSTNEYTIEEEANTLIAAINSNKPIILQYNKITNYENMLGFLLSSYTKKETNYYEIYFNYIDSIMSNGAKIIGLVLTISNNNIDIGIDQVEEAGHIS